MAKKADQELFEALTAYEPHHSHLFYAELLNLEPRTITRWIEDGLFGLGVKAKGRLKMIPYSGWVFFCLEHAHNKIPVDVQVRVKELAAV